MNPTLTGTCFAFDVPAAWTAEANDGLVTATSDESVAGFTPNVVLREWRVKRPIRSSLARASWANLGRSPGNRPSSTWRRFPIERPTGTSGSAAGCGRSPLRTLPEGTPNRLVC